jgi:hypothetical protein
VEGDAAGGVGWGEPVADSEDVVMAPHRPNLTLPAVALLAGVLLLAVLSLVLPLSRTYDYDADGIRLGDSYMVDDPKGVIVGVGVVQGDIGIGGVAVVLEALLRVATVPVLILVSRRDAVDSVNQVHT